MPFDRSQRPRAALAVLIALGVWQGLAGAAGSFPPQVALEEIERRVAACSATHPRLLTSQDELAALGELVARDPLARQVAALVIRTADALQAAQPIERKLEGRRLLGQSRRCVQRVLTLAMAFHLTGERRYADRCRQEMLAAARFTDWNPIHFLDVAEMTFALAIGYDWLYAELDEGARTEIREAIVAKGVSLPWNTPHRKWVRSANNWGQVCHGGLTAGALAVLESEPELAARTVHSAIENVVVSMAAYAPHGSYPEGPAYWSYGTSYNVLLIAMLESVFGEDFELAAAPGFAETGAYPALVCGPSGQFFNYADGGAKRGPEPMRFWFAARYGRPEWLGDERQLWADSANAATAEAMNRLLPLALLWMDDAAGEPAASLPLHWCGGGSVPIAIHRSSWSEAPATFVGLKAGSPKANHGQMDIGSFVLDSDGVRWAMDLGAENYHSIEARGMSLWDSSQQSDRWTIFRQSSFGHNTLVIDDRLQAAAGDAKITAFSDRPERAFSIVDLTGVYRGQADSVRRGVRLLSSGEVLVQDELVGLNPGSRVRWGMITSAELAPGNDSRAIRLQQAGRRLTLLQRHPHPSPWIEIDTTTPKHPWDSPNPGTRMAAFVTEAPQSGRLSISVVATPGSCRDPLAGGEEITPLDKWIDLP
ncbi:MAG: heparinase [Planctomycetota bacterium]|nr:MAG: heparinase [Planctomycetota bacterium]